MTPTTGVFAPLKAAEGKRLAAQIGKLIQPPGFTGKQPIQVRTQFGHSMGEWHLLTSKLVAEVQDAHFTGGRFSPRPEIHSLAARQGCQPSYNRYSMTKIEPLTDRGHPPHP
jgi:hypothetical protein